MCILLRRGMHTFIVAVSAVGLIAAACGGDDAAPAATEPAEPSTRTTVPTDTATAVATEPPPTASSEPLPAEFTISAEDFSFDTSSLTIPVGEEVTITFINNDDTTPHSLHVTGPGGLDERTEVFRGSEGRSRTLVFTATEPGRYSFVCDVHANMAGSITAQ